MQYYIRSKATNAFCCMQDNGDIKCDHDSVAHDELISNKKCTFKLSHNEMSSESTYDKDSTHTHVCRRTTSLSNMFSENHLNCHETYESHADWNIHYFNEDSVVFGFSKTGLTGKQYQKCLVTNNESNMSARIDSNFLTPYTKCDTDEKKPANKFELYTVDSSNHLKHLKCHNIGVDGYHEATSTKKPKCTFK